MLLINKDSYYLYKTRQNFYKYVIFMQTNCVNHGFLNMDIAVAGCFGQRQKESSCILVHEDYRCNKNDIRLLVPTIVV